MTLSDIDGDVVKICKAKVFGGGEKWVTTTTKTTSSTRESIIPSEIADKIREQGYVYNMHPNRISKYLKKHM